VSESSDVLRDATLVAFGAITDSARAKAFYVGTLGLALRYEDDFALVLDAKGIELRLQKVGTLTPPGFTTLGWQVRDLSAVATALAERGVTFERYPWLEQDPSGVWLAPSGARIAWIKDPDGNLLSIAQYPASDRSRSTTRR
jgi:catechol 2,3-dioxygenase-like lactoylglutathione lyase family enzyme